MKPSGTPESIVAHAVRRELEQRHWRVIRNNVTKIQFRPGAWTQFGEPGMPDYLALQYLDPVGLSATLWVETKRQFGGKMGDDQVTWRDEEMKLGAVVIIPHSAEEFLAEYERRFGWLHRAPYSVPGHQSNFF